MTRQIDLIHDDDGDGIERRSEYRLTAQKEKERGGEDELRRGVGCGEQDGEDWRSAWVIDALHDQERKMVPSRSD